MQCYLDDTIKVVAATPERRRHILAFASLTLRLNGIELAWHMTSREVPYTWIGVLSTIDHEKRHPVATLPEETITSLREEARSIRNQAIVGMTRLRRLTGRFSGVSGVLPGTRWIVRIFYAVLAAAERKRNVRETKGAKWKHTPSHLVHPRRCELARIWIDTFCKGETNLVKRVYHFGIAL